MTGGNNVFGKKDLFELVGGKEYGTFLTRLSTPTMFLLKRDLEIACDGIGCDIDTIAYILCTSTPEEVRRLIKFCSDNGTDIADMIIKKTENQKSTKDRLLPQLIFKHIFMGDARTNDDATTAVMEAKVLHEVELGSMHKFVDICATATYDQIERIDKALQEGASNGMSITLENLIHQKFPKQQINTYLQLWTRRPHAAKAFLVEKISKNPSRLCQFLSRYEKPVFKEIDQVVRETYHKGGLSTFVKKNHSGNLSKALTGWILNNYEDCGRAGGRTICSWSYRAYGI